MERLGVYQLLGPSNCNDVRVPEYCENYLKKLSEMVRIELYPADQEDFKNQKPSIFFIGSGGTAEPFSKIYQCTEGPYYLLTVPAWNSLAASMEILSFLQEHGERGEIIHGTLEENAARLKILVAVAEARKHLKEMRMGAIGEAITLVASRANHNVMKKKFGCEMVTLEVENLIREYKIGGYEENDYTQEIKAKGYHTDEVEKALNVYGAIKRLIIKNNLHAVTVRCFDLLGSIGTTGCLALAILNAEGIPAACEGDTRSLIAMTVLHELTKEPIFMANPSYLNPKSQEMIFAHCTLPINMPDSYELTTHFESGIGIALSGDLKPGPVTLFKCDETMERYYVQNAELVESLHKEDMCRTQLLLKLPEGTEYFLQQPISNHHMICKGHWADVIHEFFR